MEWWNKQELLLDFIPDISIPIFHTLISELSQIYQQIFIAIKRHISHQTAILPATIWVKGIVLWIRERYNLYSFLPSHNKYFKIEILGLGRLCSYNSVKRIFRCNILLGKDLARNHTIGVNRHAVFGRVSLPHLTFLATEDQHQRKYY